MTFGTPGAIIIGTLQSEPVGYKLSVTAAKSTQTGRRQILSEAASGTTASSGKGPLFRQVEQHIKELLTSSEYGPGDRIPSERDFAETLGINRATVRRAVANLIKAGLLESNGTGGTRVAAAKVARKLDIYRSIGVGRHITEEGGISSNKLLHFHVEKASARMAERLRIAEDDDVTILRRLWSINQKPFCIETSYLVTKLVPDLTAEDLITGQSLYALLKSRYGYETINADRTITISYLNDLESRLLEMTPGAAVLSLRLTVETSDGQAIEYMNSLNNPKLVVFRTNEKDRSAR
ncbi:GntR family transcriptional regulator [Allorhizobium ampelinum]|nr:GntR family transcriptional regulator [Allorhizobium ampelinum]MUZ55350.1 UTRA domain-containing protein [Agrobacterium vitis]MCF1496166.1 GntR family transcriptional regulator [Allorhizobium ampelinum]MUZ94639.1 UTRA domain-containing protein [Agrobacterium vitis]MVA43325.1 UTRA domain-containing protein [Agrobacterium vitis]